VELEAVTSEARVHAQEDSALLWLFIAFAQQRNAWFYCRAVGHATQMHFEELRALVRDFTLALHPETR
jgi:hypothetical protein